LAHAREGGLVAEDLEAQSRKGKRAEGTPEAEQGGTRLEPEASEEDDNPMRG